MAFHKLLCTLLKEYKDTLKALDILQRNKSKNISTSRYTDAQGWHYQQTPQNY